MTGKMPFADQPLSVPAARALLTSWVTQLAGAAKNGMLPMPDGVTPTDIQLAIVVLLLDATAPKLGTTVEPPPVPGPGASGR